MAELVYSFMMRLIGVAYDYDYYYCTNRSIILFTITNNDEFSLTPNVVGTIKDAKKTDCVS